MSTMTHTKTQRRAWRKSKMTGKQRRLSIQRNEFKALDENWKLVKWLRARLTKDGKAAYAAKVRILGGAAANVWLTKQVGR